MPACRKRGAISHPHGIALVALIFAITASAALAGSSRSTREPERIFVTAVSGTVSVTMGGSATSVQPDATMSLPARIVTGDDGMLSLSQAGTNVTIAADSDVEIPAEAADGQLIARLVQRRGNVFYDVAHREVGTLRVETPFLVAVIKGTQFNVAVQEAGSTISLFQGRLDIRTPDGGSGVILNAGQIASRGNAGDAIRVIGMNDVRLDTPRSSGVAASGQGSGSDAALQPRVFVAAGEHDAAAHGLSSDTGQIRIESVSAFGDGRPDVGRGADLGTTAALGRGPQLGAGNAGVSVGGSVGVGVGAGGMPDVLGVGAGIGVGGAPAALGANLNVGPAGSGASLGTGLGAGGVPASIGANLDVGPAGSGASLGASVGAGGVAASIGANLNVNPGASLGAGVTVGSTTVGVAVDPGNNGLHLGTGGSIGDNPGLHLGNGKGNNPAPPGKSHGKP